jgi:putative FmdB family regulatory protein
MVSSRNGTLSDSALPRGKIWVLECQVHRENPIAEGGAGAHNDGPLSQFSDLLAMPTYDYQCQKCGHEFEARQSMKDPHLTDCPVESCEGPVKRKIGLGAGLIFKGSGFYITDYRSDSYKAAAKKDSESSSSSSSSTASSASTSSSAASSGGGGSSPPAAAP